MSAAARETRYEQSIGYFSSRRGRLDRRRSWRLLRGNRVGTDAMGTSEYPARRRVLLPGRELPGRLLLRAGWRGDSKPAGPHERRDLLDPYLRRRRGRNLSEQRF